MGLKLIASAGMKQFLLAFQRWHKPPERVYRQSIFFALRTRSYWCSDCDAIGEDSSRCPRCQSTALLNLGRIVVQHKDSIHLKAV